MTVSGRYSAATGRGFVLAFISYIGASTTFGQTTPTPPQVLHPINRIAESMKRLKEGDPLAVDVSEIAKAGRIDAIPDLKTQFETADDFNLKADIASALVRLGDKAPKYWNYLVTVATDALNDDPAESNTYDSTGQISAAAPVDFDQWAKTLGLTREEAERRLMRDFSALLWFGQSADRRAIPLLRRGLSSRNAMLQIASAEGLVTIGDKDSVPLIIAACRAAPRAAAISIATSLMRFNDQEVQNAAKEFMPSTRPGPQ